MRLSSNMTKSAVLAATAFALLLAGAGQAKANLITSLQRHRQADARSELLRAGSSDVRTWDHVDIHR